MSGALILFIFATLGFSGSQDAAYAFVVPALLIWFAVAVIYIVFGAIRDDIQKKNKTSIARMEIKELLQNDKRMISNHKWDFSDVIICQYAGDEGTVEGIEGTALQVSALDKIFYLSQASKEFIDGFSGVRYKDKPLKRIICNFDELLDVQISVNEESSHETTGTISGRSGSALLGTLLFGVAGGVVAGAGGKELTTQTTITKKIASLALEVTTSNLDMPYIYIHFFVSLITFGNDTRGISQGELRKTEEFQSLQKWYSVLKNVSLKTSSSAQALNSSHLIHNDIAAQLNKLKTLNLSGDLTDAEFQSAKRKLLE